MSIYTISSQSGVLALFKAANRSSQSWNTALSKNSTDREHPILALLTKSDPDTAAALRKEQRQAQELLQRLKSSKKDINEQRKAAAREKVERLKAQIQVLLMMSSGDPEAVARQAAHLARELSAAAKQYASAGGGMGGGMGGGAGLVGDVSSGLPTTATMAPMPAPSAEPAHDAVQTNPMSESGTSPQTSSSHDEQQAAFLKIGRDQNSKATEQNAAREEDQKFIQTVRNLVSALRTIIKKAEQDMQQDEGTSSNRDTRRDTRQVDKALHDTQQALQNVSAAAFSAPVSVTTSISLTV